jgi:hypothetical protein
VHGAGPWAHVGEFLSRDAASVYPMPLNYFDFVEGSAHNHMFNSHLVIEQLRSNSPSSFKIQTGEGI